MRQKEREEAVTACVGRVFSGADADIAKRVVSDEEAFGALAYRLDVSAKGDPAQMYEILRIVAAELPDHTKDWLAGVDDEKAAQKPAAFLAARIPQ